MSKRIKNQYGRKPRVYMNRRDAFGIEDGDAWVKVYRADGGCIIDDYCEVFLRPDHAKLFAAKIVEFSRPARARNAAKKARRK